MSRFPQKRATKGSQFWLQSLIDKNDCQLRRQVADAAKVQPESLTWVSPLANDGWAEYRDDAFLEKLGVSPRACPLGKFWPARGPQWDALATAGKYSILIEAKSHLDEMLSPPCGASLKSRATITRSLLEVQLQLGIASKIDWLGVGYQYTNRLAHLFFLRVLNRVPAHLVFVYFCNDPTWTSSVTREQWEGATRLLESMMGTKRHRLSRYVHHLYFDLRSRSATIDSTGPTGST